MLKTKHWKTIPLSNLFFLWMQSPWSMVIELFQLAYIEVDLKAKYFLKLHAIPPLGKPWNIVSQLGAFFRQDFSCLCDPCKQKAFRKGEDLHQRGKARTLLSMEKLLGRQQHQSLAEDLLWQHEGKTSSGCYGCQLCCSALGIKLRIRFWGGGLNSILTTPPNSFYWQSSGEAD